MKRSFALLAALVLLLTLGGCSREEKNDDSGIVIGVSAESQGFCYVGDDGSYQGLDIELMGMLEDMCGFEAEYVNIAADSRDIAARDGEIDIFIGKLIASESLGEYAYFSSGYYTESTVMVVCSDSDITEPIKAEGKPVGAVLGSEAARQMDVSYRCFVSHFNDTGEVYSALLNGVVDAAAVDASQADELPEGCKVLEQPVSKKEYCIAVVKDQSKLKRKLDEALSTLVSDGTIDMLMEKYGIAQ